jgi:PEP-CTERM motif
MIRQPANRIVLVAMVMAVYAISGPAAQADNVTFTADVPNGSLNFVGLVNFNVWNADNLSPTFETDLSPGMSGNQVVTAMRIDMDAFSNSFNGDGGVSGENLIVDTASSGDYIAPAEVDMSMSVHIVPGGLPPGSVPDFPLLPGDYEPPPCPTCSGGNGVMSLFLGKMGGQSVPAGGAGTAVANLGFQVGSSMTTYSATVGFSAFDTTEQMLATLDATFSGFSLPAGATYHGLVAGVPTFTTDSLVDMSVGFSVQSSAELDFLTGAIIAYRQVPEPATIISALLAAAGLGCIRRRK